MFRAEILQFLLPREHLRALHLSGQRLLLSLLAIAVRVRDFDPLLESFEVVVNPGVDARIGYCLLRTERRGFLKLPLGAYRASDDVEVGVAVALLDRQCEREPPELSVACNGSRDAVF